MPDALLARSPALGVIASRRSATMRSERRRLAGRRGARTTATAASRTTTSSSSRKASRALLKWRIDAARAGVPKPPQQETPRVAPDLAFLRAQRRAGAAMVPAVTWIGHASTLIQAGGVNILTDPIFSERASPLGFAGPKRHAAARSGARRAAAHRRRRRLAQPLRPSRRGEREGARRASRRAAALRRAARPQGLARRRRHRQRGRARLVAERSRRRRRDRADAGAALVGAIADRPHGDALGRLRDLRARLPGLLRRRHRRTRRTSPTSTRASPRAMAPGAASTWR